MLVAAWQDGFTRWRCGDFDDEKNQNAGSGGLRALVSLRLRDRWRAGWHHDWHLHSRSGRVRLERTIAEIGFTLAELLIKTPKHNHEEATTMRDVRRLFLVLVALGMTSGCESVGGLLEGMVLGCEATGSCFAEPQ